MKLLKVKVINKYKVWREKMQPFLDKLTENGYKWIEHKKEIRVTVNGYYVYATRKYLVGAEGYNTFTGKYYNDMINIWLTSNGKKMLRIRNFLYISGRTSEAQDSALEIAIAIAKKTPDYRPDFEYQFI